MLQAYRRSPRLLKHVDPRRTIFKMFQFPIPSTEKQLYNFQTEQDLSKWTVFTDKDYGGATTASLQLLDDPEGGALFSGVVSLEVLNKTEDAPSQEDQRRLVRSGFCGMTAVEGKHLDVGDGNVLGFRIRSDGRKYLATIRTENWLVGSASQDVWHAFLFGRPGEWDNVDIPFSRFLLTHRGRLVETRVEMNPQRIVSLGIALAGGSHLQAPGPFSLGLQWIKAKNTEAAIRALLAPVGAEPKKKK